MFDKLVVVTRKTRLQELIERFHTRGHARFYLEHAGGDFAAYAAEHDAYQRSLDVVRRTLDVGLPRQFLDRTLISTYRVAAGDILVVLGQDGLVANVAKYAGSQPILGVNPDPERFDGILLPWRPEDARGAVEAVLSGSADARPVTLAEAVLNDGQRLLGFNDLFIGARTHVSARYLIRAGERAEAQSSSGVLVSTGAGSTGWISSVFNMAAGVTAFAGGQGRNGIRMDWEDPRLLYAVREPFISKHSSAHLVAGYVARGGQLVLESHMPAGGVIFSDGIESDYLLFNSGAIASIGASTQHAMLVVRPRAERGGRRPGPVVPLAEAVAHAGR